MLRIRSGILSAALVDLRRIAASNFGIASFHTSKNLGSFEHLILTFNTFSLLPVATRTGKVQVKDSLTVCKAREERRLEE